MTGIRHMLDLRTQGVGPWPMNTYALACPETGESILIDPGAEPDTLMKMLTGTRPVAILLTHSHPDHIGALDEMRSRLQVPVMAHPGPHWQGASIRVDRPLTHGETIQVGNHLLDVYHTPGHTNDMLCFAVRDDDRVIVGDTLFEGGPGKTWSAGEFQTTLRTLREVVLAWPDETVCYPGHGPAFRLGEKRAEIEAFLSRDHRDFYGDATWSMS